MAAVATVFETFTYQVSEFPARSVVRDREIVFRENPPQEGRVRRSIDIIVVLSDLDMVKSI